MKRLIADRRVVLTGASSGIGAALARALAAKRARLILVARREQKLQELAAELSPDDPSRVGIVAGDLTDSATREQVIAAASTRWGGLDLLINNAGVSAHGKFGENRPETFRQIMDINLFAAAELTRLALPLLMSGREAAVVNLGSVLGHRGVPLNSEYAASKFALRGWSESLRSELASQGIDVVLVSPGTTDTEFFDHLLERHSKLPWGKPKAISPEAVARQTLKAIERGQREIFPNWRGRMLVSVNRFLPGMIDQVMRRYGDRITKDLPK